MLYIVLIVIFLLFMGTVISSTLAQKAARSDRPRIYWDDSFMQLINLFVVPLVILFIVLMMMDWKITLIVTVVGMFVGGIILKPISERLIVYPLFKILLKKR